MDTPDDVLLQRVIDCGHNCDRPIRVLRYGRKPHVYLAFFTVDTRKWVVRVLHVRRGARQPPKPEPQRTSRRRAAGGSAFSATVRHDEAGYDLVPQPVAFVIR